MSLVPVYIARNEIDAVLVKGFLENLEIKAFINPLNSNILPISSMEGYVNTAALPYGIYVEKGMADEAKKILAERG